MFKVLKKYIIKNMKEKPPVPHTTPEKPPESKAKRLSKKEKIKFAEEIQKEIGEEIKFEPEPILSETEQAEPPPPENLPILTDSQKAAGLLEYIPKKEDRLGQSLEENEKIVERKPETPEAKFDSEFNIKKEELEQVKGYNKLSGGQRMLILENLRQLAAGRIQEEALSKYKEKTAKSKFFGKYWQGIAKHYQIAKLEKSTAKQILKGGMSVHGEILKQLIKGSAELGPEAEIIDGKLEIKYVSGLENLSEEDQKTVKYFNQIASKYSKTPYEWALKTADTNESVQFTAIKTIYEKAKKDLVELQQKRGKSKEQIFSYLSDVEGKIQMNQFFNTNPEAEEYLQNVKNKSAWKHMIANTVTEKGLYFGMGAAGRSLAVGALGWMAAPAVAGLMGGFMHRSRGKETLKEREKMARKGVKDTGAEAANFVDAKKEIIMKSGKKIEAGLTDKLDGLSLEIATNPMSGNLKKKLASLAERIDYTKNKLKAGLINFGDEKERISNQYGLIQSLNTANSVLEAFKTTRKNKELRKRLNDFLERKEKKITKKQKAYLRNQFLKGAAVSAGAASLGAGLRYAGEHLGWWGNATEAAQITKSPAAIQRTSETIYPIAEPPEKIVLPQGEYVPETPEAKTPFFEDEALDEIPKENMAESINVSFTEEAREGDSVWKLAERQLEKHYGGRFSELTDAQKTYAIDAVKDKIASGLKNPDLIKVGQKIDFSPVFEDKPGMEEIFNKTSEVTRIETPPAAEHPAPPIETKEPAGFEEKTAEELEKEVETEQAKIGKSAEELEQEVQSRLDKEKESISGTQFRPSKIKDAGEILMEKSADSDTTITNTLTRIGYSGKELHRIKELELGKFLGQQTYSEKENQLLKLLRGSGQLQKPEDMAEATKKLKVGDFLKILTASGK